MNVWIDPDVNLDDLIRALASKGLAVRQTRGVFTLRIQRAETVAIDLAQARDRRDGATDIAMREGIRALHGLPPKGVA